MLLECTNENRERVRVNPDHVAAVVETQTKKGVPLAALYLTESTAALEVLDPDRRLADRIDEALANAATEASAARLDALAARVEALAEALEVRVGALEAQASGLLGMVNQLAKTCKFDSGPPGAPNLMAKTAGIDHGPTSERT